MSGTLLLMVGAVPLADGGRAAATRRRNSGPGTELFQLVVREALDRILLDSRQSPPGPPPNTPAAADNNNSFTFPPPSVLNPADVADRMVATTRRVANSKSAAGDGNEAEDEQEDEAENIYDEDAERQTGGRKRCRVLSFSGAVASARRVPHKRTREMVPTGDELDEHVSAIKTAAAVGRTKPKNCRRNKAAGCSHTDGGHPGTRTETSQGSEEQEKEEQQWRLLGQELRGVALKFAMTAVGGPNRRRHYSVKISASAAGDVHDSKLKNGCGFSAGELSTNVVCLAVNFLLWRLLRRLFAAA